MGGRIRSEGHDYKTCPAGATTVLESAAGAGRAGSILRRLIVVPTGGAPAGVQIQDGAGAAWTVATFALVVNSITVDFGKGVRSTAGAWSVICGAQNQALAVGDWA